MRQRVEREALLGTQRRALLSSSLTSLTSVGQTASRRGGAHERNQSWGSFLSGRFNQRAVFELRGKCLEDMSSKCLTRCLLDIYPECLLDVYWTFIPSVYKMSTRHLPRRFNQRAVFNQRGKCPTSGVNVTSGVNIYRWGKCRGSTSGVDHQPVG